jgi:RNA polymerase sigma-70 factor (ECF subfamily)
MISMPDGGRDPRLEAARRGDADALEALLAEVQPRVYRFSLQMCGRAEDAQDVLQETLFAAVRTLAGFRGDASVSTWLYTIARRFCLKKRRRRASGPELVSLHAEREAARRAADPQRDPERRLADEELASALRAAIASLEPGAREVLVLRDVEGLAADEVAAVTGVSVAAVKSRLHRARLAVRRSLEPWLAPPAAPRRGCPDVVRLLSRHLEGEISPETCAEMERHVAACAGCRAACDSLRETLRVCRSSPSPEVPAEVAQAIRRGVRLALEEDSG